VLSAQSGFEIVAQADDGASTVALTAKTQPDVALLDIEMPGNKPLQTMQRLREASPHTRVIIVSMYADPKLIQQLLELGIRGYLHKSVGRHELTAAIRSVQRDKERVVISVAREGLHLPAAADSGPLSTREQQILTLVATAMSNRQIGTALSITEGTVKLHLRNTFRKLGAVSRIDAVNKATVAALISRPPVQHRYPA